ncbi:MAG: phosphopentomutase [Clostridiaceae bacterium]|mgnify:FL=1|nr:phosphopentomutase [Clostridiaceae bacterium]
MDRVIILVLDSAGIGEQPDSADYGDEGSNTLGNIAKAIDGFTLPNLEKLGLGCIDGITDYTAVSEPLGCFGKMTERSIGKDTTTGHWELAGIRLTSPFPLYPEGFPSYLVEGLEAAIGTKTLGNYPASGTEIIKVLGRQHVMTGYPIIYTSADSVLQIAAHEEVIPIERQYEICKIAREIMRDEHAVGRVIARPFVGSDGGFTRTERRRDFSLKPIRKTIMDYVKEQGNEVKAVGKIEDIFAGEGITQSVHINGNMDGVDKTLEFIRKRFSGLIFTNLVDFDMHFGHRNNVEGYAQALREFDDRVPELMQALDEHDMLIITADHGCDPTTEGTDHTREYVPLLVYGKGLRRGMNLGIRKTFADVAQTVSEIFNTEGDFDAESFYKDVIL